MSIITDMLKGFQFQVCGRLDEPLKFTDEKSGDVTRMLRILGFGKCYTFFVDSDEAIDACPPASTEVRAVGVLRRKSGTSFFKPEVTGIVHPGAKNWKPFTDDDIVTGCRFAGWGIVTEKKTSEYRGQTYRNLQVGTMGDTILFRDFASADIFETIPEKGPLYLTGHIEPKNLNDGDRRNVLMVPVIDVVRAREAKDDANVTQMTPEPEKRAS